MTTPWPRHSTRSSRRNSSATSARGKGSTTSIAVAEYIDWYNHRPLHGELGHILPVEAEDAVYSNLPGHHRDGTGITEPPSNPGLDIPCVRTRATASRLNSSENFTGMTTSFPPRSFRSKQSWSQPKLQHSPSRKSAVHSETGARPTLPHRVQLPRISLRPQPPDTLPHPLRHAVRIT